jgi:hypothetical protein
LNLTEFQDALQKLSGRDFERFVLDVLRATEPSQSFIFTSPVRDAGFDVIGQYGSGAEARKTLVVVKHRRFIGADVAHYLVGLAAHTITPGENARLVLVVSGSVTANARVILQRAGIGLIDVPALAAMTPPDVAARYLTEPAETDTETAPVVEPPTREKALLDALNAMPRGLTGWAAYQRLVAEILEYLFCPPLDPPRYEFADADRRNRRDLIFENSAQDGFWSQVRAAYEAHYIVVDAKNYDAPLKKAPVLDIAHYLKPYGCGMFSLLVSRRGFGAAAAHAVREQWIGARKLIVGVDDDALEQMLAVKAEGGRPEEILRRIVADFRMTL